MAGFAGRYTWNENWDLEKKANKLGEDVGYTVAQLYTFLRIDCLYPEEEAKKLIHETVDMGIATTEDIINGLKTSGYFEEGKF